MRSLFLFFLSLSIFSFHGTAQAADVYDIDPSHTRVVFFVDHLGFSNMPGVFKDIEGQFSFDKDTVEQSTIDLTINASSVDIFHEKLTQKLLKEDYFNVSAHPTITFKSVSAEKTSDNTGIVIGDLTLLGVTNPVTLNITYNKGAMNPYAKKYAVGFSGTGVIKRSDFGMETLLPNVGDEVSIRFEVEGLKKDETPSQER